VTRETLTEAQEYLDTFYHANGPCCAGCDWWRSLNSRAGECTRSTMIPGVDRAASLGLVSSSLPLGAGQALTVREHVCGEFKDEFDWSSLPPGYRRRIGDPNAPLRSAGRQALADREAQDNG
jgi:hypothetical protein